MKTIINAIILLTACYLPTVSAADSNAGAQKAEQCFGCHGNEGNSSIAAHPTLAGQQANYLSNQLNAFRTGTRTNAIMNGMAKNLSNTDIQDLAAFFASRTPQSAGGDPNLAKAGSALANTCLGCHGNGARGNGAVPRLAGQQPAYLSKQLHDFKSGARKGGPMQAMVANLSDSQIEQLAAYLGSLK